MANWLLGGCLLLKASLSNHLFCILHLCCGPLCHQASPLLFQSNQSTFCSFFADNCHTSVLLLLLLRLRLPLLLVDKINNVLLADFYSLAPNPRISTLVDLVAQLMISTLENIFQLCCELLRGVGIAVLLEKGVVRSAPPTVATGTA
ncbi:hypothetical protein T10_9983 [Trichinella papuae]|uniref:Secreted protein n=1 Tax=Trichinella papuae TaxID=268474 RepID=A0A0V1N6L3_9BILA|nr:hypothetical protein T10_9983 [Trichinella papuae]